MAYITCNHLTLGYDGRTVISDLNFKVEKGDYLCIVGENGTGKSTLVKTLLHLQEKIDGEMLTGNGLNPHEIGYLPQQTIVQKDFPATVWEIVLSGTLSKCGRKLFFGREEKSLAKQSLKRLGIWNLKQKCYRHLSGGQQQRTLLARALCATDKILLLDEPVTGLDPKATAEFYEMTKELNAEGVSIIMVSHDIQAVSYATHILHMQHTHTFYGTKEAYLKSDYRKLFEREGGVK